MMLLTSGRARALKTAATASLIALMALALIGGTALAGKPGGGTRTCVRNAPTVIVDNTWTWGQSGSFGVAGQQLTYSIDVINRDAGCAATTFVASIDAPSGFSVAFTTGSISLKSASSGYLWATVTSPLDVADGDHGLTVNVMRSGTTTPAGSGSSWYKVYSWDSVAPTLFWQSPGDGATISGRSYNVAVSSNDDHRVRTIGLSIDGAPKASKACDGVAANCELNYPWAPTAGQHTATWVSTDWLGNQSTLTSTFTVS